MSSIGAKPIQIPKDISFSFPENCNYQISQKDIFFYSTEESKEDWILELKGNYSSLKEKIPQDFGIRFYLKEAIAKPQLEKTYNLKEGLAIQLKLEKRDLTELKKDLPKRFQQNSKRQCKILAKNTNILWGSLRQNLAAGLEAASQGLSLSLNLSGLGFKAFKEENQSLLLKLGFSHNLKILLPSEIEFSIGTEASNRSPAKAEGQKILLKSSNKTLLHSIADQISKLRSPEPYKGKGIIIQKPEILQRLKLQRKQGKKKSN